MNAERDTATFTRRRLALFTMHAWQSAVEDERREREAHYLGPDTPLSPAARKAFHGLSWWPIDQRFRVAARLHRHAVPKPGNLAATGDESVLMLEIGEARFDLLGQACRLLAFAPAPGETDEDYVLIPFRDGTTGKETYGAGRYLDLEPHLDDIILDFNRAYHPYCAHDDQWSCTLPPPANRLAVRVEAGERLWAR